MIPPQEVFSNTPSKKPLYFVQNTDDNLRLRSVVPVNSISESCALGRTTKFNSVFSNAFIKSDPLDSFETPKRQAARHSNFKLLSSAKKLLASTKQNRVCVCFSHRADKDKNIFITHNKKMGNAALASYRNVVQCSAVHTCIICNNRIMKKRGLKASEAYDVWVHDRNNFVPMLTLTIPHYQNGDLYTQFNLTQKAFKRLMDDRLMRKFWDRMGKIGIVKVIEYTHGKNGHHNHIHVQPYLTEDIRKTQVATALWTTPKREGQLKMLTAADEQKLIGKGLQHTIIYRSAEDFIKWYWSKVCVEVGLGAPSHKRGAVFTYGDKVKRYLTKHKSAQEITNSRSKKANNGNRTQWELLLDYGDGDSAAGDVFREYAEVFKGSNLLQFSSGLLHSLGLQTEKDEKDEIRDARAAGEIDETTNDIKEITPSVWHVIKFYHKQADVLAAAENDHLNETHEYDELISELVVRYHKYQMRIQFAGAADRGLRMKDMRPP